MTFPFTRHESAALDHWLTQGPPDDPMWCNDCGCDSDDCEQPQEHMDTWVTYEQRDREQYEDDAYDAYVDSQLGL